MDWFVPWCSQLFVPQPISRFVALADRDPSSQVHACTEASSLFLKVMMMFTAKLPRSSYED